MAFRDLLLAALTYPDATPDRALRSGVALAKRIGGELSLISVRAHIPSVHNRLANALVDLDGMAASEEARSGATAELAVSCAGVMAEEAGVALFPRIVTARLFEEADVVCEAARTHDLTLISIGPAVAEDRSLAEAVLFGSGRPIIVYPEEVEITAKSGFGTVAIAWDGSARAARAVADALPILQQALLVRVLVATHEKPQATPGIASDLIRHLRAHRVEAHVYETPSAGAPIGSVLRDFVDLHNVELLVMGGFGHHRVHEFVLGGATRSVLEAPPCPVLMSH